jgi:hypothetical protein
VTTPQRYGAVANCTADDWWPIQQAVDAMAARGGGTVRLAAPDAGGCYRIGQALRLRSGVRVEVPEPGTMIKCTGDAAGTDPTGASHVAQWPFYACIMFGSGESGNLLALPTYPVAPISEGDNSLTFANPGDAARFVAGDIVDVESRATWTVGADPWQTKPRWLHTDRVIAVSAVMNRVTLRHALHTPLESALVRKLTNTGLTASAADGRSTNIPMWASAGAAVVGGTWIATHVNAPFIGGGGALDCRVQPHAVVAAYGVAYGNLFSGCEIGADLQTLTNIAVEMAWGSHDNVIRLGRVEMANRPAADKPFRWLVSLNEGAHDNELDIDDLDAGSTEAGDVVYLNNASGNQIRIGRIVGGAITGNVVELASTAYGGTPGDTFDNVVEIESSAFKKQNAYVLLSGGQVRNNIVTGRRFLGAITQAKGYAVILTRSLGPGNVVKDVAGAEGAPYCDTTISPTNGLYRVALPHLADMAAGSAQAGGCRLAGAEQGGGRK